MIKSFYATLAMLMSLIAFSAFALPESTNDSSAFTNTTTSTSTLEAPKRILRIGVLNFNSRNTVLNRWQPTLDYVASQTSLNLVLVPLTPNEMVQQVVNEQLDFIISNALITVAFKKDYGVSNLLSLLPQNSDYPEHAIGSSLITRKDSNIKKIQDITTMRVISTDLNAFGGFQIMAGQLIELGINPQKDIEQLKFVGFPQRKLLQYIVDNQADVAILPSCVLEAAIHDNPQLAEQLQVVFPRSYSDYHCQVSSELYPYYTFSKVGKTDHETAKIIAQSLLSIQNSDEAASAGKYQYWTVPVKDSHVFELLKKLKRWPFVTNWTRLLQDATPWAIAIFIGLFIGYLHHLRVKQLVVKRTQALHDEMLEHKATQKALFEQQQQFYRAQRVLLTGEMASGIAHELNQPLAGIRYLTQGCIYRLDEQQTELHTALNKTIEQVDRAQSTIKKFRQFCHQPSVYQQCSLTELISDTLNLMKPDFNRLKLQPKLSLDNVTINADASLLQQVLVNLIRNALDAMENSHSPQLLINVTEVNEQAQLIIMDNGIGLSEAKLERLFFPFETSKPHGLGLGMVVCKRICEEHGGKIKAVNNIDVAESAHDYGINVTQHAMLYSTGLTIIINIPIQRQNHV
ncbi:PhnD/SsuA/transferrin family substrate-binding protein [uncultured Shewanella sp.]|uniref:sensor histidine kinase n=1 Tax=uncultured Shewanella sp. TaxID=173975 RepID=UPI0026276131|nr:PhnD/SsuA/transferrin family substrate-binding protein [uncultured Shewanella sp.]